MAKYNWQAHRFSANRIFTFHFGRRLGKTTKIITEALKTEKDNAIIICATSQIKRYTIQIAKDIFTDMGIELSIHNRDVFRVDRANGRLLSVRFMDIEEATRRYAYSYHPDLYAQKDFYIDNLDLISNHNPEYNSLLRSIILKEELRAVSFTSEHFQSQDIYQTFYDKILARNKKLYYNKIHDERTFNRYINFGNFSSRADADAELRPGAC
jgi:hypothetical protein